MGMGPEKYAELEERAFDQTAEADATRKAEARSLVHRMVEEMKAEGTALVLSDEEMAMLRSFRRFKLRMRKDGEVFTWQSRRPEGVQLVSDTAQILHPSEV